MRTKGAVVVVGLGRVVNDVDDSWGDPATLALLALLVVGLLLLVCRV